jgi:hypothetical protein
MVSEEKASKVRSRRTLEYIGGIRITMRKWPNTTMALSLIKEECLLVCLSMVGG